MLLVTGLNILALRLRKKNIKGFNISYEKIIKQFIWIYAIHVINNEV
jgi:hypothetical protein